MSAACLPSTYTHTHARVHFSVLPGSPALLLSSPLHYSFLLQRVLAAHSGQDSRGPLSVSFAEEGLVEDWHWAPPLGLRTTHIRQALQVFAGLPRQHGGEESTWQYRRLGFSSWARKLPWDGKQQPTPVFLPRGRGAGQATVHGVAKSRHG